MQILTMFYRSKLSAEQIEYLFRSRAERYAQMDGLVQKIYVRDQASGVVGGIYLFDTAEHLQAFVNSDLADSIGSVYQAIDQPTMRTLDVVLVLNGPTAEKLQGVDVHG